MSFWQAKNVTVTGGCGFLGSHFVDYASSLGAIIKVIDNCERGQLSNVAHLSNIEIIQGDLTDLSFTVNALKESDIVVDFANRLGGARYLYDSPASIMNTNLRITANCLEAAKLAKVERYLFVSSSCVYGHQTSVPHPEEEAGFCPPESAYGWSKLAGEQLINSYLQEYGMRAYIVRLFNAYGPRENFFRTPHVIPIFIRKLLNREPIIIYGTGEQTRSFTYVTDLIRGIASVLESNYIGEPFNIGSEVEVTMNELVERIAKICNVSNYKVVHDSPIPTDIKRRSAKIDKIRSLLGWEPETQLDDGIRMTLEWYKQQLMKQQT